MAPPALFGVPSTTPATNTEKKLKKKGRKRGTSGGSGTSTLLELNANALNFAVGKTKGSHSKGQRSETRRELTMTSQSSPGGARTRSACAADATVRQRAEERVRQLSEPVEVLARMDRLQMVTVKAAYGDPIGPALRASAGLTQEAGIVVMLGGKLLEESVSFEEIRGHLLPFCKPAMRTIELLVDQFKRLDAAARAGNLALVQSIAAEEGCDVSRADPSGNTALHQAAQRGHVAVVECLLRRGANVTAANQFKETPVQWAAAAAQTGCMELLTKAGADIRAAEGWMQLADESFTAPEACTAEHQEHRVDTTVTLPPTVRRKPGKAKRTKQPMSSPSPAKEAPKCDGSATPAVPAVSSTPPAGGLVSGPGL